jgi:pimeloyl-ACP methyl ester carboxylesterase
MRFQCPACGFTGAVRIPAHLPRGKTVRIRCSRCQDSFPLSLGRLFPQEYPAGYQALTPDSLGCRGDKVGRLWVETIGTREDRAPLVVLPSHPAFPHDVMHDLLDPFGEYCRICYLEFPGTRRNPQAEAYRSFGALLGEHVDGLKEHLGCARFHLLAHLGSAALALDAARHQPDSLASIILIEPDLRTGDHAFRRSIAVGVKGDEPQEQLLWLLQETWSSGLPRSHAQGLATILAPGFRSANLNRATIPSGNTLRYPSLSRLKTPALVYSSRDGGKAAGTDALYLQSTLPAAETVTVERGGPWVAWFHHSAIAGGLLSFKRRAQSGEGIPPRKRSHTLNGQPLGWMVLVFAVLAAGLTFGAGQLRFQPPYISGVIPPLLAGLLPILWFIVPRKINPLAFLRFRGLSLPSVLLPLVTGTLLGAFFRCLLLTLAEVPLPTNLPGFLVSAPPGSPGRPAVLAGIAMAGVFVFAVAENIWMMRRSRLQILMPALLFTLLPPAFPDILWRLPAGFAASVLFACGPSIYAPLFLIAGFGAASELPLPFLRLPIDWGSVQGVGVTLALLAGAIALTVLPGTTGKPAPPTELYLAETVNREGRLPRWNTSLGVVLIVFSLIVAAGFAFSFIAV